MAQLQELFERVLNPLLSRLLCYKYFSHVPGVTDSITSVRSQDYMHMHGCVTIEIAGAGWLRNQITSFSYSYSYSAFLY